MDKLVYQDHLEKMENQDQQDHPDSQANEESQDMQVPVEMKVLVDPLDQLEKTVPLVFPDPVDHQDPQD